MNIKKPHILLLSVIPSDFSKLFNLAKLLRENGFEPIFYFDQRAHSLSKSIKVAENNSFRTFYSEYKRKAESSSPKASSKKILKLKPLIFIKRLFSEIKNANKKITSFRYHLRENKISLVITSLNMYGYDLPLYRKATELEGVVTACLPFAIGDKDALEKGIFAQKKSYPDYLYNTYFTDFFKEWRVFTKSGIHLGLPAETLLTYKLLSIRVEKPLSFYGLGVDHLLLENEYMYEHALKQGVGARETIVTGAVFDDDLFQLKSNKDSKYKMICRQYNLKNKKCILIALPPLINNNRNDPNYLSLNNLLEKFLPDSIDFSDYNLIISPHPRIEGDFLEFPLPGNVTIIKEPVETLLPISDLFITTYSSTIRTAAALNKPILNFDFLGFKYDLFSDFSNMVTVIQEKDYRKEILKWMDNHENFVRKGSNSNKLSSTIDGKSGERIINKIKSILES